MRVVVCASLIVISLILTGISDAKVDLNTAVGMWLFDEGSGNIAKDSSGNGNDGQLTNGPKWVQGRFVRALEFDGKDDYVKISSSASLR